MCGCGCRCSLHRVPLPAAPSLCDISQIPFSHSTMPDFCLLVFSPMFQTTLNLMQEILNRPSLYSPAEHQALSMFFEYVDKILKNIDFFEIKALHNNICTPQPSNFTTSLPSSTNHQSYQPLSNALV